MINFLIVTHGEFGAYLVEAAEAIVGAQPDGVRIVSISPRHSIDIIRESIVAGLKGLDTPDGVVVVSDMPGGTPTNVALPLVKDSPNIRMVSGLNLYMLIVAFTRRSSAPLDEVVSKMVDDGRKSIQDVKKLLEAHRSSGK
ncbi:MAG: PTS fructose transporter subunit IIA [Elusimicrobiota bacterium]